MFIEPELGGPCVLQRTATSKGAPELVAEVATSSVRLRSGYANSMHTERAASTSTSSGEVLDRKIDWFVLNDGRFEPQLPSAEGILRSTIFPGLWLDQAALFEDNLNAVLAIVQRGLSSLEHSDFVRATEARQSRSLKNEPAQVFVLREGLEPLADERLVDDDVLVGHGRGRRS